MQIRPWDKLQALLVPLSSQEKSALVASIQEHGVLDPILVLPDGRIIDGFHRWEISQGKAEPKTLDLDDKTALSLGITINIARRQMSPEQIKELQKNLKKDREIQKKVALALRKKGKSQEKVAAIVGVDQSIISDWEKGIPIMDSHIGYNPLDLKVKIPKKEYEVIYQRVEAGETQTAIASDYKVSQARVSRIVKKFRGRKEKEAKQKIPTSEERGILRLGDFTKLSSELKDDSIPLILTDPPYGKEWLGKWTGLAELAYRVLSPGGFLITYSGQTYLPQVFDALLKDYSEGKHLNYFWTSAILLPQGNSQQFHTKVVNNWKPAIILTKGKPDIELLPWWLDVVKSQLEKDLDEWQQSVDIARYFIKTFSRERTTVLDPCAGTGTFLVAALLEGRNAHGYELDPEHYQIALARLSEAKQDEAAALIH